MEFQLKQLYLIEGYKPTCIQVDAHYTVENSDQDYLWPVRILVKGRLTMCNETLGKIHYLPIKHFHFLLWTGVLNGLVCAFGFILHCFKLLAFILVGKVCMYIYISMHYLLKFHAVFNHIRRYEIMLQRKTLVSHCGLVFL